MTVFIKRYPSRGELPQFKNGVYQGYFHTEFGLVKYSKYDGWKLARTYPDYYLEEIELPSEEEMQSEIYHESMEAEHAYDFQQGGKHMQNFILNHLKSNTNG